MKQKYYFENGFGQLYTVEIENEYENGRVDLKFLDPGYSNKKHFCHKSELLEYLEESK